MITSVRLPSGPLLLSERCPGLGSFTISAWIPNGSRHEAPGNRGFFHFIEHMLFKGTSSHDSYSLLKLLEASGGFINGFTDRDSTCLSFTVPASDWQLVARLSARMFFDSTFPVEEFEKERRVILSEILQVEDDVEESAFDAYLDRFWQGDPAALSIAGTTADVAAIDRDALFSFYRRFFTPGNALFVASGEFDDSMLADSLDASILECRLADCGQALPESREPPARTFSGYRKGDSSQVHYFDGFHMAGVRTARELADLSIVSNVLGESSTSRLFHRIREKMGCAYTIQSSVSASRTESILLVQAIADPRLARRCIEAIDEEVALFLDKGISAEEIAEAARRLKGSFILSLDDPEFRNRRLARWQLSGFALPTVDEEAGWLSHSDIGRAEDILSRLKAAPRGKFCYGAIGSRLAATLHFPEV